MFLKVMLALLGHVRPNPGQNVTRFLLNNKYVIIIINRLKNYNKVKSMKANDKRMNRKRKRLNEF